MANYEIRNKSEARFKSAAVFEIPSFEFLSSFEIRHSDLTRRLLRRRLPRLTLRRSNDHRDRITQFHDIIDQHLDIIRTSRLEFDLSEQGHIGRVQGSIL